MQSWLGIDDPRWEREASWGQRADSVVCFKADECAEHVLYRAWNWLCGEHGRQFEDARDQLYSFRGVRGWGAEAWNNQPDRAKNTGDWSTDTAESLWEDCEQHGWVQEPWGVFDGAYNIWNYSIEDCAEFVIYIPKTDPLFALGLAVVLLQLLRYYVSVAKGLDVDKPRNLAKSVTVEWTFAKNNRNTSKYSGSLWKIKQLMNGWRTHLEWE